MDVGYVQHAARGGGIDAHSNLRLQCPWNGCDVSSLAMYEVTKFLLVLLGRLNFRGGVFPGKSQTDDWTFVHPGSITTYDVPR